MTVREQTKSAPGLDGEDAEFTRYKAKLFRGLGARYHSYVQFAPQELPIGMVRIKIYVRFDGVITNLEILEGKNNNDLAAMARRSIMDLSGQLEPFSENLRKKLGDGFSEEIRFWMKGNESNQEEGGSIQRLLLEQSKNRKQAAGQ